MSEGIDHEEFKPLFAQLLVFFSEIIVIPAVNLNFAERGFAPHRGVFDLSILDIVVEKEEAPTLFPQGVLFLPVLLKGPAVGLGFIGGIISPDSRDVEARRRGAVPLLRDRDTRDGAGNTSIL
jgi:hypothetical protein